MPARSQAQFRMMQAIAHGANIPGVSMSADKAAEYVSGESPKGLPKRVLKRKKKRSGAS